MAAGPSILVIAIGFSAILAQGDRAQAQNTPKRKPGLWQQTMTSSMGGAQPMSVTMCTDEKTDDLLTSRAGPEKTLRHMNEAGVLGRFIPEFGRVVSMMQFNMYHHYTVDEHLLKTVGELKAIEEIGRAHV